MACNTGHRLHFTKYFNYFISRVCLILEHPCSQVRMFICLSISLFVNCLSVCLYVCMTDCVIVSLLRKIQLSVGPICLYFLKYILGRVSPT